VVWCGGVNCVQYSDRCHDQVGIVCTCLLQLFADVQLQPPSGVARSSDGFIHVLPCTCMFCDACGFG
jgi:hypothetical protein